MPAFRTIPDNFASIAPPRTCPAGPRPALLRPPLRSGGMMGVALVFGVVSGGPSALAQGVAAQATVNPNWSAIERAVPETIHSLAC